MANGIDESIDANDSPWNRSPIAQVCTYEPETKEANVTYKHLTLATATLFSLIAITANLAQAQQVPPVCPRSTTKAGSSVPTMMPRASSLGLSGFH